MSSVAACRDDGRKSWLQCSESLGIRGGGYIGSTQALSDQIILACIYLLLFIRGWLIGIAFDVIIQSVFGASLVPRHCGIAVFLHNMSCISCMSCIILCQFLNEGGKNIR